MILPIDITFDEWAKSLLIDFPTDDIPIYHAGNDWQEWGNMVAQQTNFSNNATPSTSGFDDKMKWAMATYKQMSNFS